MWSKAKWQKPWSQNLYRVEKTNPFYAKWWRERSITQTLLKVNIHDSSHNDNLTIMSGYRQCSRVLKLIQHKSRYSLKILVKKITKPRLPLVKSRKYPSIQITFTRQPSNIKPPLRIFPFRKWWHIRDKIIPYFTIVVDIV